MTGPSGVEMLRVLVVGDLMVDVLAALSGPIARNSDTRARVSTGGGGSGANVAAWMAAQGAETTYVGCVGDDPLGRASIEELAAGGVTVRAAINPELATGMCVVLVDPDGERSMLPDSGANAALEPADLPAAAFAPGAHLHLSGYTLLHEGSRAAGRAALAAARDAGMTVSVDPSSAALLAAAGRENFVAWTTGTNVLFANEEETAVLAGTSDVREAATALATSYGEVVVKLGGGGALWHSGFIGASAPAETGVEVVDTTGAGDAFAAGFLTSWLLHPEPESALAAGNTLAATAIRRLGARP